MHQFVFSFEVGWRLCFSLICPRNNGHCPKKNDANTYENANAKRDSIVRKRTEAWLNRAKENRSVTHRNFGWQTDGRRGRVWSTTVYAITVAFLLLFYSKQQESYQLEIEV
jgi:hypothetical protein